MLIIFIKRCIIVYNKDENYYMEEPNDIQLDALISIGLSLTESKFYLALLKTGPSTILPVSQKAGIKRTSAYNFIEKLVELGLVSFYIKNNRHYYHAEDPNFLKTIILEKEKKINNVIPELQNIYNQQSGHPQTKLFYGNNGMKEAIMNSLTCIEKKVYMIIDIHSAIDNLGVDFWEKLLDKATKQSIVIHSLRHNEQKKIIPHYKYLNKNQYKNILLVPRYLPRDIKVPNTIVIYDDIVVTISPPNENWALITQSESFSQSMKSFHLSLWKSSK